MILERENRTLLGDPPPVAPEWTQDHEDKPW